MAVDGSWLLTWTSNGTNSPVAYDLRRLGVHVTVMLQHVFLRGDRWVPISMQKYHVDTISAYWFKANSLERITLNILETLFERVIKHLFTP